MVTHNPVSTPVYCAHCHNLLAEEVPHLNTSTGDPCCSFGCLSLVEEKLDNDRLGAQLCTNCAAVCGRLEEIVYSQDGLPFCSGACVQAYPKVVSSPEVRRILCSVAACMFLCAAFVLLMIIEHFSISKLP